MSCYYKIIENGFLPQNRRGEAIGSNSSICDALSKTQSFPIKQAQSHQSIIEPRFFPFFGSADAYQLPECQDFLAVSDTLQTSTL